LRICSRARSLRRHFTFVARRRTHQKTGMTFCCPGESSLQGLSLQGGDGAPASRGSSVLAVFTLAFRSSLRDSARAVRRARRALAAIPVNAAGTWGLSASDTCLPLDVKLLRHVAQGFAGTRAADSHPPLPIASEQNSLPRHDGIRLLD
jgi:hypothetical protein